MSVVTLSTVVDLSKIKMKWKEQYVSEGLNHKLSSSVANGIYRGLQLVQNITSPRRVTVGPGSDTVHAAVFQSATGFSLNYFDVGASSFTLDLSSSSLDNQETVIALSITYTVGADTTASWKAYPIADWNALTAAQQAELVVLGTVNVPAPAANITTSMINMKRRSWAWENPTGALVWSPLVKNGGFEHAQVNGTTDWSASFWRIGNLNNAIFKVQNSGAHSGANCMVLDHTATGLFDSEIEHQIGVQVTPGQLVKYRFFFQNLKVPVSGNGLRVSLRYVGPDMVTEIDTLLIISLGTVDASYREITDTVAVPAGAAFLVSLYIDYTNNQSSTGLALRLDDFQVWLQTSAAQPAASEGRIQQYTHTGTLVLEDNNDPFANFFSEAVMLRNNATELRIERRDLNRTTGAAIQVALPNARITRLGADLLNTEARALLPRFTVPVSVTAGVDFTLMWESVPSGQIGYRKYISATGALIETVNAKWGGTTWTKDVNGTIAVKSTLSTLEGRRDVRLAVNDTAWNDSSWDSTAFQQSWGSQTAQFVATLNIFGDLWLANGGNITLNGTGYIKHGTRTLRWMTSNASAAFLSGASPSNTTGESFGTGSTAAGTWFVPLNPWPSTWRVTAARFFLPNTIVGTGGVVTLQERNGGGYTSISSDFTLTNGQSGLQTLAGITANTHAFPIGLRMNLSVGSTTTALISFVEIDYDVI